MLTFTARFSRYCSARGERRTSGPQTLQAETFGDAYRRAADILLGLQAGDPTVTFEIQLIEAQGVRGVVCDGSGAHLFETADEFSDRLQGSGK